MLQRSWQWLRKNPLLPWVLAFVLLNVLVSQDGESNAASRFATLQAMAQNHTFQIDAYKDWTGDWSPARNGHIYSNKAPGPMLIAFPVAWGLSAINRYKPLGMGQKAIICLITQVIPFAIVTLLISDLLGELGVSLLGRNLAVIAILFGNTADFFMNCFFGHGMGALFVLAALLAFLRRRPGWAGFFFGFAVLSDYGAAFLGPPLIVAILWTARKHRDSLISAGRKIILGGLIPGALWVWYHWTCFGSPLRLPMQYRNPYFVHQAPTFSLFGPASVWYELLLGPHRGVLFTQPWVYVAIATVFWFGRKELRSTALIVLVAFAGIVWMNAGFEGWHGGACPGPRYLSPMLPAFGILAASVYDRLGKAGKTLLWGTVGASVVLRMLIYCDILYAMPNENLWVKYVTSMRVHFFSKYAVSFTLFCTVMGGAAYWARRIAQAAALQAPEVLKRMTLAESGVSP